MASINTYPGHAAQVALFLNRRDLTDQISTFTLMAESSLNQVLRVRLMLNTTTGTATGEFITLPVDYLASYAFSLTQSGSLPPIQQITQQQALQIIATEPGSGSTRWYTIRGPQIRLIHAPTGSLPYELTYYQTIPGLEQYTSNWLSFKSPKLYLAATMREAMLYLMNAEGAQTWDAEVQKQIALLTLDSDQSEFPMGALTAQGQSWG